MADIADVQQELAALISKAVYPEGADQPSVTGYDMAIYAGWPLPEQLDADMRANRVNVSVWARGEVQNTTRFPETWSELDVPAPTITATVSGYTVTIGGVVNAAQAAVVVEAQGQGYAYGVSTTDTPATIAAGLAELIPGASASGAVVTLPVADAVARIAVIGTVSKEVRRQTDVVQIVIWSPTFELRTAVARAIDAALADLRFIDLPDGYAARLIYKGNYSKDKDSNSLIYRRDMLYTVEYPTTVQMKATQIASSSVSLTLTPR